MFARKLLPLALMFAASLPAYAAPAHDHQHGGAPAASAPQGGPGGMMGMMQGQMPCPMMGHADGTLAFLKAELKITDAQAGSWSAFETAYRSVASSGGGMGMGSDGMMGGMMSGMNGNGSKMASFPDRAGMHLQMMERRLDATKKLLAAAQPLYAKLDATQRAVADRLLPMTIMMAGM